MKAHHRGPEFLQHFGGFTAERRTPSPGRNGLRIDSKFSEVWREHLSPDLFSLDVRFRRRVAEEIDIIWLLGLRADGSQFLAHEIQSEHGTRERSKSASVG